jgi:uncharacterized protein Smg (DUF494 family)
MTNLEKEKIEKELTTKWYNKQEIAKILQWLEDLENWQTFSSEEIYKSLLNKKTVYT